MVLANGLIPNEFGEWVTLFVFLLTVIGFSLYGTKDIWNTHTFKRRFVSKKNIVEVQCKVIKKEATVLDQTETLTNSGNVITNLGGKQTSKGFHSKTTKYFVTFESESRLTLEVTKAEYDALKERQMGILKYSRLIFIDFMSL